MIILATGGSREWGGVGGGALKLVDSSDCGCKGVGRWSTDNCYAELIPVTYYLDHSPEDNSKNSHNLFYHS